MRNLLFHSDNILALNQLINDYAGKIDLIYIDPPFATQTNYRISKSRASTISSHNNDEVAYSDMLVGDQFLSFLRERLVLLHKLLSERGSIYLHIDYKIGHYVKVMMDEIFGIENFRNDITRIKCNPKNFHRKAYGNIKDMILFYSKTSNPIWNDITIPLTTSDQDRLFRKIDSSGRRYTTIPLHAPGETAEGNTSKPWRGMTPPVGRHWRTDPESLEAWDKAGLIEWSKNKVPRKIIYLDEKKGKKIQDIWEFKDPQYPRYPTEKNLDMVKLIIQNSSNINSYVLDCFVGSGTTIVAAHMLNRQWIGVDQSKQAIKVVRERLEELSAQKYEFVEIL